MSGLPGQARRISRRLSVGVNNVLAKTGLLKGRHICQHLRGAFVPGFPK